MERPINIARVMLGAALVLLVWGLAAPALTITRVWIFDETISIWSGIWDLLESREYSLFGIVFTFSMLFPAGKILLLCYVAARPSQVRSHTKTLRFLEVANRFSMLDVFAAALLVVISKLDALVNIEVHGGIYLFGTSVLMVQFTSMLLLNIGRRPEAGREQRDQQQHALP